MSPTTATATTTELELLSRLGRLPQFLGAKVRGQSDSVGLIAKAVQRGELGVQRASRPKGSFLFLGPTGTGKTETTLTLTEFLIRYSLEGQDWETVPLDQAVIHARFARFDMAEYQNIGGVERLLGSNKSEQGLLGDEIDRLAKSGTGSCVLLFDEMEKAHPDLVTIFLAAMDAARVTMSNGAVKDLQRFYLCMTSNLGSGEASRMETASDALMHRAIESVARQKMRPELFARFDERVIFRKLTLDAAHEIAQAMLHRHLQALCTQKNVQISSGGTVLRFLVNKGYDRLLGARPMRRAVELSIDEAWTDLLLGRAGVGLSVARGERLLLVVNGNALELRSEAAFVDTPPPPPPSPTPASTLAPPAPTPLASALV